MLDILLNNSSVGESLTFTGSLSIIVGSLILGLFISLVYIFTHQKEQYSSSFTISLIILPAIIAMIILLIGNNVARAFSLAGAFSLIRFRSTPGDSKDITYVFFSLGVGLACGMGYIGYAVMFSIILCSVMAILNKVNFGNSSNMPMGLKIVLPEDMDYYGTFDTILEKYTTSNKLVKVKTTEFGSLFELHYNLYMKDMINTKSFIDEIRCKNGNLNVLLYVNDSDGSKF